MQQTIFCVEDDNNIRELVVYALQSSGFQAVGYEDAASFTKGIHAVIPDLILLDIMLPDEDGIAILNRIKHNSDTANVPVIMLTAKTNEYDKIKGLDAGADDYVTKPFGVMELISRIKAVLRRTKTVERMEHLVVGKVQLDNHRHVVMVNGEEVALTYKEFELLYHLMKNKGIVLSRDQLLELVWNIDYEGESRTVDVHIGSLRQKLGEAGGYIQTVRGVGYRLTV